MLKKIYIAVLIFVVHISCYAKSIQLAFPVDCTLNKNCYIQYYVAHDKNGEAKDYRGGKLTYAKHKGTDIAVAEYEQIKQGIPILAAAPGTVVQTRNNLPDHDSRDYTFPKGKNCGNGLLVDHGNGWTTQYCHMRKGSIVVWPGQQVEAGEKLGELGASGEADFPHLHFTVRENSVVVDPFVEGLWREQPAYYTTGLISMGMSNRIPKEAEVLKKPINHSLFTKKDQYVIAWVRIYGTRNGMQQRFVFYKPDGEIFRTPIEQTINKDYIQYFTFFGYPMAKLGLWRFPGRWRVVFEIRTSDNAQWQKLGERTFRVF